MSSSIPIPPLELRELVGPTDPKDYDNPSGAPIYAEYGVQPDMYATVFDFGCGCGRLARKLLLQNPRPRRYVGIDVHRGMVEWCRVNLTTMDPHFEFFHHDVYSPMYEPGNSLQLALPLPMRDGEASLLIAHSVFTHLSRSQTEYYLSEVARIVSPNGTAFTSWFFFDRASFPFRGDVYALYSSEVDFSQAVLFDREWFLATVRNLGLGVRRTVPPPVPGHQWIVFLVKRTPDMVDDFPIGEVGAEWVSGSSLRPRASVDPTIWAQLGLPCTPRVGSARPERPPLYGALSELDSIKRSRSWKVGRALTAPIRLVRRLAVRSGAQQARGW